MSYKSYNKKSYKLHEKQPTKHCSLDLNAKQNIMDKKMG